MRAGRSGHSRAGGHRARCLRARRVLRSRRTRPVRHAGVWLQLRRHRLERKRGRHRSRARPRPPCRFEVAHVPPLRPARRRRTAARDDARLSRQGEAGGGGLPRPPRRRSFAFTLEEGLPSPSRSGRSCPTPTRSGSHAGRDAQGARAGGLVVRWQDDWSRSHPPWRSRDRRVRRRPTNIAARIGRRALDDCWPLTGCGASGLRPGAFARSRSWRS